jgi:hypothetical protein
MPESKPAAPAAPGTPKAAPAGSPAAAPSAGAPSKPLLRQEKAPAGAKTLGAKPERIPLTGRDDLAVQPVQPEETKPAAKTKQVPTPQATPAVPSSLASPSAAPRQGHFLRPGFVPGRQPVPGSEGTQTPAAARASGEL